MSLFFYIGMIMFVLSGICVLISAGLWTYADAKVRSNNPELWTVIVIFVNFPFGLIAYLIAGRKKTEKSPGKYKKLLIIFAICFVFSSVIYIGEFIRWIITTS